MNLHLYLRRIQDQRRTCSTKTYQRKKCRFTPYCTVSKMPLTSKINIFKQDIFEKKVGGSEFICKKMITTKSSPKYTFTKSFQCIL